MKQASEKAGVSWSPELGDSSQVLGGGAGGANMWDCTPKGSKNFVSLSKSPGLCGWFLGGRAPPHPVTHLWPLGLLQCPGGGKRAALRGSLPVPPPFLQHTPSPPPPAPFVRPHPPLQAPGWADRKSPARWGAGAGQRGLSPPPPPRHPGARPIPPPPAPSVCHLPPVSLSPWAPIPGAAGGGGAADSAPPSWLLPRRLAASALALALGTPAPSPPPSRTPPSRCGRRLPLPAAREAQVRDTQTRELGRAATRGDSVTWGGGLGPS